MLEHMRAIRNRDKQYPVARHFEIMHNANADCLSFYVVDSVPLNARGGNREVQLRCLESRYIIEFETMSPNGHNKDEELSVHLKK